MPLRQHAGSTDTAALRRNVMADEFVCDTATMRRFIGEVKAVIARSPVVEERLVAIRPSFTRLLADPHWLPTEFRRTAEAGGMGKGVANWLLYRDGAGTLSFSALILSPGAVTPVHDHLAWGLVGLYAGEQQEEVYQPAEPVRHDDRHADLKLVARNRLTVGSFYELIPPTGDIHRVLTTSPEPSISLHLLGNDVGCVVRHRFDPTTGEVLPFRSGYSNRDCEQDEQPGKLATRDP
jgi:predicted metal-dependent enzyme (double-stranded beta helix superfamily)